MFATPIAKRRSARPHAFAVSPSLCAAVRYPRGVQGYAKFCHTRPDTRRTDAHRLLVEIEHDPVGSEADSVAKAVRSSLCNQPPSSTAGKGLVESIEDHASSPVRIHPLEVLDKMRTKASEECFNGCLLARGFVLDMMRACLAHM